MRIPTIRNSKFAAQTDITPSQGVTTQHSDTEVSDDEESSEDEDFFIMMTPAATHSQESFSLWEL
jgi:hypothetical protein